MIDQIVVFIIMVLLYKLKKIYGTAELKQLTKEMPYIHMCVRKFNLTNMEKTFCTSD